MTQSQIEYQQLVQAEKARKFKYAGKRQAEIDAGLRRKREMYRSGSMDEEAIQKRDIRNACVYGRLEVVKKLCEDDTFVKAHSGFGKDAVWNAAVYGRLEVVKFLLTIPFICENLDYEWAIQEARAYEHDHVAEYLETNKFSV
jgi:hypothetical protein